MERWGWGKRLHGQTAAVFKRLFLGSTIWCVPLNSPDGGNVIKGLERCLPLCWEYLLLHSQTTLRPGLTASYEYYFIFFPVEWSVPEVHKYEWMTAVVSEQIQADPKN